MKRYINMLGYYGVETIDEFEYNNSDQRKEAHRCLKEYRVADRYNSYYLSQRSTKEWKDKTN